MVVDHETGLRKNICYLRFPCEFHGALLTSIKEFRCFERKALKKLCAHTVLCNFALEIKKQCFRFQDNNKYNMRKSQGSDAKLTSYKKQRKEKDYVYKCSNAYHVLYGSCIYRVWLLISYAQSCVRLHT